VAITTGYGTVKIEYNERDKITGLIDAENNKIRIKYDAVGNMVEVIAPGTICAKKAIKLKAIPLLMMQWTV